MWLYSVQTTLNLSLSVLSIRLVQLHLRWGDSLTSDPYIDPFLLEWAWTRLESLVRPQDALHSLCCVFVSFWPPAGISILRLRTQQYHLLHNKYWTFFKIQANSLVEKKRVFLFLLSWLMNQSAVNVALSIIYKCGVTITAKLQQPMLLVLLFAKIRTMHR